MQKYIKGCHSGIIDVEVISGVLLSTYHAYIAKFRLERANVLLSTDFKTSLRFRKVVTIEKTCRRAGLDLRGEECCQGHLYVA